MPGRHFKNFSTLMNTARGLSLLKAPALANSVVLNFWSPGYKVLVKAKTADGFEYEHHVFKATTTFDAAVGFLKDKYGNADFLKFKGDAHPGHVLLLTTKNYLSAAAGVTALSEIGFNTQHELVFRNDFQADCIGFSRLPEKMINFHSLAVSDVDEMITEVLATKKLYAVLGGRFGFSEGESCATACYLGLAAGGFDELLSADRKLLSRHTILTPAKLAQYAEIAKINELGQFPNAREISNEFNYSGSSYITKIGEYLEGIKKQEIKEYVEKMKEKKDDENRHDLK